jgi:hypothetical protein
MSVEKQLSVDGDIPRVYDTLQYRHNTCRWEVQLGVDTDVPRVYHTLLYKHNTCR